MFPARPAASVCLGAAVPLLVRQPTTDIVHRYMALLENSEVRDATPGQKGKAPFLCAPYTADKEGRYKPSQGIDRCPLAKARERCHLVKHSFRHRKTGPEIGLRILHCKRHQRYFTVYPPGHVPYARYSLADVDFCGEAIERLQPEAPDGALFEAAAAAATGHSWAGKPDVSPRTQRRWVERSAQILGLVASPVREWIREHLGVEGLHHHLACRQYERAASLKTRSSAILEVEQRMASDRTRLIRLLAAGSLGGQWGHPWLWEPARGQLFSVLGRTIRTVRAPPNVVSRLL